MQVFHPSFFVLMVTFVSLNARGLRSCDRWQSAFSYFRRARLDIICLQETHWTADVEMQIKRDYDGEIFASHGTNSSRGVAVLISSRLDYNVRQVLSDSDGRVVNILLDIEDETINLVNVYAPSSDCQRRTFFSNLEGFLSNVHANIIGGDFNCIADPRLDKLGGNPNARQSAVSVLTALNSQHGLIDIWRVRHKDERSFTWTGGNPNDNSLVRTRIDKFFISLKAFVHSDHDCVTLTLDFECVRRGPGFWHFNNDLLNDVLFQADIEHFWSEWQNKVHLFDSPLVWWDRAKLHFKTIAIKRAKIRGKLRRHERAKLERELGRLQVKANNGNSIEIEQYLLKKEELKQFDLKELESVKIRAKAQFLEEGEKSTRYFYSLEKSRKAGQTIRVLTKKNLDTVSQPQDLIAETYGFYKDLFSAEKCDESARDRLFSVDIPKLSDEARAWCEGRVTVDELRKALFSMENNKSPGVDGLTTNFYKHFWPLLCDKLALVYNYAFETGCLTVSQRRGIISLVFKKGDRTLLKNWRPISLLTTDYKILTKALANRLQRVLSLIVHSDQTASVKGRTINDNARLLHDSVYYANECNIPLAFITVDQLKAFDRVSHDFLFKALEAFGFGSSFMRWIRVIYNAVSSSVKVNGWLTAFIDLKRGLRQGCALSMPLYVLVAEMMAINIRANPNIHGLRPPGSGAEVKLSQFADDTTLLLTDDRSIEEAFCTFDLYERASGARINLSKCKGLWSGAFSRRTDQLHGVEWFNDYIPEKILGQFIGNIDCSRKNWESKIQKINNVVDAWRCRDLSFKGKASVINGLLTSTLWYNATSLSLPSWALTRIEQSVYRFFWNDKQPLVSRNILSLPLKKGGFNVARLELKIKALRLNTLRRLLTGEEAHWKHFTSHFLRVSGMHLGRLTLATDFAPRDIDSDLPAFHRELLCAWINHKCYHERTDVPDSLLDIFEEPLFRNKLINVNNKPLFFRDWVSCGLVRVKDICYEAVPGFLPVRAVHEIIMDHEFCRDRTLNQTARELSEVLEGIPAKWKLKVINGDSASPLTAQPSFSILPYAPDKPPTALLDCKTRHFYWHFHKSLEISTPGLDYWRTKFQLQTPFDSSLWSTVYSPLITNKQGDLNWKVAHKVLLTALRLNRMDVYPSENCHRCGVMETIEHELAECPLVCHFWNQVQVFIDKITGRSLNLTTKIKLLGWIPEDSIQLSKNVINLVNWTLTIARFSIHKAAANFRIHKEVTPILPIFRAITKSIIRFQFKIHELKGKQYLFPGVWCIGHAFVKLENYDLVFMM